MLPRIQARPRIQKHFPEFKNTSKNPTHVPESKNTFGFWKVFLDSGKCFGFCDVFLDSGKCFGFWNVFLVSKKFFGFWEVFCPYGLRYHSVNTFWSYWALLFCGAVLSSVLHKLVLTMESDINSWSAVIQMKAIEWCSPMTKARVVRSCFLQWLYPRSLLSIARTRW